MSKSSVATAQATAAEPPRIKKFRRELVNAIPRVPNDRASKLHMQQKQLGELLIDYINWRSRYVGQRPRTVTVEPAAKSDPRWSAHASAIEAFLDKVRRGDDLTPHLSIEPHTRGYAPAARASGATSEDRWSDKDFLLNVMGFHHFHLGTTIQKRGHVDRTDELIFAEVHRDTFKLIAIFGHEVFEQNSTERMRLWSVHEEIAFRGVPAGSAVVTGPIATSGHNMQVVRYAQQCAKTIRDYEAKLDDPNFVKGLYPPGEQALAKPKFEWRFRHLDLLIHETVEPRIFILTKGWN
jgi:hypothetical protein